MMASDDISTVLDQLCPMYVRLDSRGHVVAVGPTLQKLRPQMTMPGQSFLEIFDLVRPRSITSMATLLNASGEKLHLRFRSTPQTALKGVVVPLANAKGAIVNLSFGISILDAVRDYTLTASDFSATDLAIELLYLVEAKSAAMEASRTLNLRLQGAKIAAEEQAFTDTLTGLKNRRAMDHILIRLIGSGVPFALMNLDLDFFKAVNDTLGHAAGDHVLQQAARIMVDETRQDDMVARAGGDEFVLVFYKVTDQARLHGIASRLIERLEKPMAFDDQSCRISASIGINIFSGLGRPEPDAVVHQADLALYAAKRAGRGCFRFYDDGRADGDAADIPAKATQPGGPTATVS